MMKHIHIAIIVLAMVSFGSMCLAYETDFDDLKRFDRNLPAWKLGRGFVNILSLPEEIFANMTNNAINGSYNGAYSEGLHGSVAGALNGYIAGIIPGVCKGVRRMTTGMLEILTFWKPEYGPTIDPQYGTRCKAFGEQDYFNPQPFWYWGPDR
jgi:putative exosortase-associated protein (TIGR04073 family)